MTDINLGEGSAFGSNTALGAGIGGFIGSWFGNGFGYGIAPLDGISRTMSARYYKDGSEILIAQERKNPRRLTPRECARLQGFPENFKIPVSDTQAYRQFGNSVAVPVIRAIAKQIINEIHYLPCKE